MSMDIFLKIEGIDGESKDDKHKDEIQLLSWSWGMTQTGYHHMGGGGGAGKVNVQDMNFNKYIDKSTAALMMHCCNGKHIPWALLTVRKAGGDQPVEYLKIKMEDIIVTSYGNSGSMSQDDLVVESFSFNFGKYRAEYTEQTEKGAPGKSVAQGWDMRANKENR
jgi:type VI secretion system secreted protein Hcp